MVPGDGLVRYHWRLRHAFCHAQTAVDDGVDAKTCRGGLAKQFELRCRSTKSRSRKLGPFAKIGAPATYLKQRLNLFGENSFAGLAFAPPRVVQFFPAPCVTNPFQYFR